MDGTSPKDGSPSVSMELGDEAIESEKWKKLMSDHKECVVAKYSFSLSLTSNMIRFTNNMHPPHEVYSALQKIADSDLHFLDYLGSTRVPNG